MGDVPSLAPQNTAMRVKRVLVHLLLRHVALVCGLMPVPISSADRPSACTCAIARRLCLEWGRHCCCDRCLNLHRLCLMLRKLPQWLIMHACTLQECTSAPSAISPACQLASVCPAMGCKQCPQKLCVFDFPYPRFCSLQLSDRSPVLPSCANWNTSAGCNWHTVW